MPSGSIYTWTESLASRKDMVEVDLEGNVMHEETTQSINRIERFIHGERKHLRYISLCQSLGIKTKIIFPASVFKIADDCQMTLEEVLEGLADDYHGNTPVVMNLSKAKFFNHKQLGKARQWFARLINIRKGKTE